VDLDALREEVQTRQSTYWQDMDNLRQMVYGIQ
jgi:hypothetical protein